MLIRLASLDDHEAIIQLWRRNAQMLGNPQHGGLRKSIQKGFCYVAEHEGKILGFVEFWARQDGWTTIHHLATEEGARCQGIGSALLFAVPCPIRLKVTADNLKAIHFYEKHHMKRIREETSKKGRLLYVYELRILFIQVAGNNRKLPEVCRNAGVAYGSRHNHSIHAWPVMIDLYWKAYDWGKYLKLIAKHRPLMATVADYERPEQKSQMLEQVEALKALGVLRVLVCPKFEQAIQDIPSDCIIALSIPSQYAGYIPPLEQLRGKRIHLLGGTPTKQRRYVLIVQAVGAIVTSADGNSHVGRKGIWMNGRWIDPKGRKFGRLLATETSAHNIAQMLQHLKESQPPLF